MREFDTVILGSGYFSIGYALNSENVLIVERTQLADPNFGGTLNGFRFEENDTWTAETKSLHSFYQENKIVDGDRFNSSVSESALCAYVKHRKLSFLLGTECIGIEKCDGGYRILVANNGGNSKIFCKKVIDTRCFSEGDRLNVLLRGDKEKLMLKPDKRLKLAVTGAFETCEFILSFCFLERLDVNSAKAAAMRYLEKNMDSDGIEIVQFAYLMHSLGNDGSICAASYTDAFSAFDAGVKAALEGAV